MNVCITNSIPDLRSCVVPGQHMASCDGWARRYRRETGRMELAYRMDWNPDERENERILIECRGCLPRTAPAGFLCETHRSKLEHALRVDAETHRVLVDLVMHLWSAPSGGIADDNDRVSSAYGSRWPLQESRIQANAIYIELAAVAVAMSVDLQIDEPEWSPSASIGVGFDVDAQFGEVGAAIRDLVEWIEEHEVAATNRPHSAEAVVRMIAVVQTALHRFPLDDTAHTVKHVRCPHCGRMSLEWRPPLFAGDDVEIVCDGCGHSTDQDYLDAYIDAVKTDPRRNR